MTTNLLDSQDDLGINAPVNGRVKIQKTSTCAPIQRASYTVAINTTRLGVQPGKLGDTIVYYKYGDWYNDDGSILYNYTWIYNTHSYLDGYGYGVKSFSALGGQNANGWKPIPALDATDADLSLMFVSANSVSYNQPVDDPIFAAHQPLQVDNTTTIYETDGPGGVIGCSEQYRICNPVNHKCTPYRGSYQNVAALGSTVDGLGFNLLQNATALRIAVLFMTTSEYRATNTRSGNCLRASEILNEQNSPGLPANQWQIEVSAWFDAGLAALQAGVQQLAANTANLVPGSFLQSYDSTKDEVYHDFCYSQLVNDNAGTISFSILGLAILFIVGGLIIFTSLTIDTVIGYIQQKSGKGLHARMEWLVNDKLQTHMMLMRELRLGQWYTAGIQGIPTTVGGAQKFWGPAENELRAQSFVDGRDGETGVQLVQHEAADTHEAKGWNQQ